jgi:hypothetical protein
MTFPVTAQCHDAAFGRNCEQQLIQTPNKRILERIVFAPLLIKRVRRLAAVARGSNQEHFGFDPGFSPAIGAFADLATRNPTTAKLLTGAVRLRHDGYDL